MKSKKTLWIMAICMSLVFALTVLSVAFVTSPAHAQGKESVRVGLMFDATGPTMTWGSQMPVGGRDYVRYLNKKGGINGHRIDLIEHEMGYKVPLAVEGYERYKREKVGTYWAWGTPIVYALTEKTTETKIPATTPGFGRADATDGRRFPYIFPIAATYWSQAGASIKFIMDQWAKEGKKGKPKIAYVYFDNPAGTEPIVILEKLQKQVGFKFKKWAIPSPGIEQSAAVLDVVNRYRADWVISHSFGKGPSILIRELFRNGFPLNKVIGFVWAGGEMDMEAAGWDTAEGYYSLHFAGVGTDLPIVKDMAKVLYQDAGFPLPATMTRYSVGYNRGVLWMAVSLEAARIALEKYGTPLTGEKVKNGFEQIKDFSLGGMPPLTITPNDHEGGGFVQIYQTKKGKLVPVTDWFKGHRDVVLEQVKLAGQAEKK
jgi:branched-chain amino acid transport system substrate-binding protein